MVRTSDLPEIVGLPEAAEILGVKAPNVRKVRGLPEPRYVSKRPIWSAEELRAFARERAANGPLTAANEARREAAKKRVAA